MDVTEVLDTARSQVGYTETGSNVTRYWADLKPEWQGSPWCAAFIQWCLWKHGAWFDAPLPYYCPSLEQAARSRGAWHTTPRPGDLALFHFGATEAIHVGWVERVPGDGTVVTIEGNTSSSSTGSQTNGGGVYRRTRNISSARGFARPTYGEDVMPLTDEDAKLVARYVWDYVIGERTAKNRLVGLPSAETVRAIRDNAVTTLSNLERSNHAEVLSRIEQLVPAPLEPVEGDPVVIHPEVANALAAAVLKQLAQLALLLPAAVDPAPSEPVVTS